MKFIPDKFLSIRYGAKYTWLRQEDHEPTFHEINHEVFTSARDFRGFSTTEDFCSAPAFYPG